MKILVVGHSVEDHIHIKDNETLSPGGIFYSAMALDCFKSDGDEVSLMTSMDKKNETMFSFLYDRLDRSYFSSTEAIPKVHLIIMEKSERCERYENLTQRLPLEEVYADVERFQGILINMITGFDVSLESLIKLRELYRGMIFLDLHTLSRGLDEQNRRMFRVVPEAEKWLGCIDILQVNEHELFALSNKKDESEIIREALLLGLKYLVITKGEKGSEVYWLEQGSLKSYSQPAINVKAVNRVGCGDVFGSVFFLTCLKTGDIIKSMQLAGTAAGCATQYSNVHEFLNLKNDTFTRYN